MKLDAEALEAAWPHVTIAGRSIPMWPQERCPVCAGTGMVCSCCHYGGNRKVPCGRVNPQDKMCECCVPLPMPEARAAIAAMMKEPT